MKDWKPVDWYIAAVPVIATVYLTIKVVLWLK